MLDELERQFSGVEDFKAVLLAVEAVVPRPKEDPIDQAIGEASLIKSSTRIHREELYSVINARSKVSWIYFTLVLLSAIVATVGLARENVAVIIGAMVIAPLLGPNVALALGTTLYDKKLIIEALKANLVGVASAFIFAVIVSVTLEIDLTAQEIVNRTQVGLGDIALALASGVAGGLAFTTRTPASLVGVMVAVALLPPLLVLGLFIGAQDWSSALGAFLLLATNVICINLAGVLAFLVQGVGPRTWWEKDRAKISTRLAIGLWGALLIALILVIYLSQIR